MLSFCIINISLSLEFMHSNNRFRNNPENIFKDCDSIKNMSKNVVHPSHWTLNRTVAQH